MVGVKALSADGLGLQSQIIDGIEWAVEQRDQYGIEAMNLSIGSSICSDGTDALSEAVDAAGEAGILPVVAAGNSGPATCTVGSPGAAKKALTVGAMADTAEGGFGLASFSSRGTTLDLRIKPEVVAPGVDITSARSSETAPGFAGCTVDPADQRYCEASGTSMATPFTAGVSLLMLDANESLTADHLRLGIALTAVDIGRWFDNRRAGRRGPDLDYGVGRLDAYAAIRAAGADLDSPPEVPEHTLLEGELAAGASRRHAVQVEDTNFPLAATLIVPDRPCKRLVFRRCNGPESRLQLLDPSGNVVESASSVTRQVDLTHDPAGPGTYRLRVESAGGGRYFIDVSGARR